jgi:hypothetical protein
VVATVLDMSMSLDGFIAGPNAGPGNGLGDGGNACTSGPSPSPVPTPTTSKPPAVWRASAAGCSTS